MHFKSMTLAGQSNFYMMKEGCLCAAAAVCVASVSVVEKR